LIIKEIVEKKEKGNDYFNLKEYDKAIEIYTEAYKYL
jgi:hypothetical protein